MEQIAKMIAENIGGNAMDIQKILEMITSILSGGTTTLGMKIGLVGLLFSGGLALLLWWKKMQVTIARKVEQANEVKDKSDIAIENKVENQQAQADGKAVDDFLK